MTVRRAMQLGWLAGFAFLLAGCVNPDKVQKTRADAAQFDAELQARQSNEQCSQNAMPGTPEHLACRLATDSGK